MIKRDLGGARTLDPLIKSQLLYQLSYEVKLHSGEPLGGSSSELRCKGTTFSETCKYLGQLFSQSANSAYETPLLSLDARESLRNRNALRTSLLDL